MLLKTFVKAHVGSWEGRHRAGVGEGWREVRLWKPVGFCPCLRGIEVERLTLCSLAVPHLTLSRVITFPAKVMLSITVSVQP